MTPPHLCKHEKGTLEKAKAKRKFTKEMEYLTVDRTTQIVVK